MRVSGKIGVVNLGGKCIIGDNFLFTSGNYRNPMARNLSGFIHIENGTVKIGNNVGMGSVCIMCVKEITIGDDCTIGANVIIVDTDGHSIYASERKNHSALGAKSKPIHIGNDVFIGVNSVILKGVAIGDNAVIGAGSIVNCDIPANEIWGGNPARFLRKIEQK